MKLITKIIFIVLITIIFFQRECYSDKLILKDNTKLSVIIISEKESEIEVLLSSGPLIYKKTDIAEIIRETKAENEQLKNIFESAEKKYADLFSNSTWPNICIKNQIEKKIETVVIEGYDYILYLPETYNENNPLPIVYVLADDRHQLKDYIKISEKLQLIMVFIDTHNRSNLVKLTGEVYAIVLDVFSRLSFDPSAQYIAGIFDNSQFAFIVERCFREQISGVYSCGGDLGIDYNNWYQFKRNLMIARVFGENDKALKKRLADDKKFLEAYDVIIKDWVFKGGRVLPPAATTEEAFLWLLDNRKSALQIDVRLAQQLNLKWHTDYNLGKGSAVFEECLLTEMNSCCTWQAYQARKMINEILDNYKSFSKYRLKSIKYTKNIENYFCQIAYASILSGDVNRLKSSLVVLDKIGLRDPVWAANLATALVISPHKPTRSIKTACILLEKAIFYNKNNSSLKLIGAAICVKNCDYAGANRMLQIINNNNLDAREKVLLCEIAASIAEKKDKINMYSWYKLMRF
jgi:hypothetical protein